MNGILTKFLKVKKVNLCLVEMNFEEVGFAVQKT